MSEIAELTRVLSAAGCIAAREEAGELIDAARGDRGALDALVARRAGGEPLAWLTGRLDFAGVEIRIEPGVYVPRWQTEALALRAASLLSAGGVAVDLCTGSGAIAAVMASVVPTARVLATEIDPDAARCARANGVEVLVGHLDEPLPEELVGRVDVLTAVVPYVPTDSIRLLPRDVREWEPRIALDGGADGMELMTDVARRSVGWLRSGGWVLLELGGEQAESIDELLGEAGFDRREVMTDAEGDPRAVCARLG